MFDPGQLEAKLKGSKWMTASFGLPVLLAAVLPQVNPAVAITYAVVNTAGYWVFISGRRRGDRFARWARGAAWCALPLGMPLALLSDGDNVVDSLDTEAAISAQQVRPQLF